MILIVDEDPVYRDTLASLLKTRGYKVDTAGSIVVGLKKIRELQPTTLVVDAIFPCSRTGVELVREVEKNENGVDSCIIVTTALLSSYVEELKDLSPKSFVFQKPVDVNSLITVITKNEELVGV